MQVSLTSGAVVLTTAPTLLVHLCPVRRQQLKESLEVTISNVRNIWVRLPQNPLHYTRKSIALPYME